jgi:hypothetical protein
MRFTSSHLILCAFLGVFSMIINVLLRSPSFGQMFPMQQDGTEELLQPTRLVPSRHTDSTYESDSRSGQHIDRLSDPSQVPLERRRIRRKTVSDRSRTPYADAASVGLVLRLKALKKQLTQALQSPIAGVPAASSATKLVSTSAGETRVLGRAPADDASAGPWEFPGEPGLYSALKHSLGQVVLLKQIPEKFACLVLT